MFFDFKIIKRVALLVTIIFLNTRASGQSLLVSFIGNDCSKCQVFLSGFLQQSNKMPPVFFIFPEGYRKDSADLAEVFSNFKGTMVFNDRYFNLLNPKSSSIAYLNAKGGIGFKKSLMHLSPGDWKVVDSLYNSEAKLKIQRPDFPKVIDGWKINENSITKTVVVDSGSLTYRFKPDSITVDGCIKAINKVDPGFYERTTEVKESKSVPEQFLRPGLKGFTVNHGVFYYILGIPYIAPPTEQDVKMGNKGRITSFTVMVRVRNGIETDYLPIISPMNIPGTVEEMVFPARSLRVLNDSFILFFQYPVKPETNPSDTRYLSLFKILKDRVIFEKRLDNQFPKIYFQSGLEYKLSPSFMAFDYPYYTPEMGTQIADVRTGKDITYNPPYTIDYLRIDSTAFIRRLMEGKDRLPVSNTYLFNRKESKTTCLISAIDSVYYLNVFSTIGDSLKLISTVNLSVKIPSIAEYAFFNYDTVRDFINIEDETNVVRSFPLELLIGKS